MSCLLRNVGRLHLSRTALLICDLQEKFRSKIAYFSEIVTVSNRMLRAANILGIRTVVTEMYPKGLGRTVPELGDLSGIPVFPKTKFSMIIDEVVQALEVGTKTDSVLLCGIETHICVQETALDLLERGVNVHCIADACSSRSTVDRMFAYHRMRQSGAYITTNESAILSLVCGSDHPQFRALQSLIIEPTPDTGLLSITSVNLNPLR